jgi:hypothetical protein
MPKDTKIKTFSVYIPDLSGKATKKTMSVFYDKKADIFWLTAPDHLAEKPPQISRSKEGEEPVKDIRYIDGKTFGRTPKEVEEKFERACRNYIESLKKVRKVIVYKLSYKSQDNDDVRGDLHFSDGVGFLVDYEVGYEISSPNPDHTFIYHYNPTASKGIICNNNIVGGDDYETIEWTKEREQFFESLENSLQRMVEKAKLFLGNKESLVKAIEDHSAQALLPNKT